MNAIPDLAQPRFVPGAKGKGIIIALGTLALLVVIILAASRGSPIKIKITDPSGTPLENVSVVWIRVVSSGYETSGHPELAGTFITDRNGLVELPAKSLRSNNMLEIKHTGSERLTGWIHDGAIGLAYIDNRPGTKFGEVTAVNGIFHITLPEKKSVQPPERTQ